jgi:hypothetical protein
MLFQLKLLMLLLVHNSVSQWQLSCQFQWRCCCQRRWQWQIWQPSSTPIRPTHHPSECLPLLPFHTMMCSAQKEELLKLGGLTKLLALMEDAAADNEAAYAAAGCLASMAAHPKCLQDLAAAAAPVTSRVGLLRLGESVTLHEFVQRFLQMAMSGPAADTADAVVHNEWP